METRYSDLSDFKDIGTVVFYGLRSFYPELHEVSDIDKTQVISESLCYTYLHSINQLSEYIDFAKYTFSFDMPKTDYWKTLVPNLFEPENTRRLFGRDYDQVSNIICPQLSDVTTETEDKCFFGRIISPNETINLIQVPSYMGIWKVEVYNSRVETNNELGLDFVDADVLEKLGEKITSKPICTIILGPNYNTGIQDLEYLGISGFGTYYNRYVFNDEFFLTEDVYNGFKDTVSKVGYIRQYRSEIESDKLLYIVNSTSGELKDIDFFSIGYTNSDNKHQHQPETSLRNDNNRKSLILDSPTKEIIWDTRNRSLLSLHKLSPSDCPWFFGKYNSLEGKEYSSSGKSSVVRVNKKEYTPVSSGDIFGVNPVISPWWISVEDIGESLFETHYIMKSGKGEIIPSGLVYNEKNTPLTIRIYPSPGYRFLDIPGFSYTEDSGKIVFNEVPEKNIRVIFEEIVYNLKLFISCLKDYPKNGGYSHLYSLETLGESGIDFYYLSEGKEVKYDSTPITIKDTEPLYFRLDFKNSIYHISGVPTLDDKTELKQQGDYFVIDSESFVNPGNIQPGDILTVLGEIESNSYSVLLKPGSEIQSSKPKINNLEYGQLFSVQFAKEGGELGLEDIFIVQDGVNVTEGEDWEVTVNEGVLEFSITGGIKNNYEIIVNNED